MNLCFNTLPLVYAVPAAKKLRPARATGASSTGGASRTIIVSRSTRQSLRGRPPQNLAGAKKLSQS